MTMRRKTLAAGAAALVCGLTAAGCAGTGADRAGFSHPTEAAGAFAETRRAKFELDRRAILAMAGDYRVAFSFTETVPFIEGYDPKPPYKTSGDEIVRVIEDRGDFISLQHILVVGGEEKIPVKHWRQDWIYEPEEVIEFVGGAAWRVRALSPAERKGKWAQIVYQVDDAPRYGAVAEWRHENGVSEWTSPPSLRPLPRRDATKRDDYDAILAVNRHAIAPWGWVHEQDNSKLALRGKDRILVREIGVNTYTHADDIAAEVAEDYWAATKGFWAGVRAEWARIAAQSKLFGLTIQGEPEALYDPVLALAGAAADGAMTEAEALAEARAVIARYATTAPGALEERLAAARAE
ncbi:DUF6607 family protein [Amphiplicatus metriothermophilus]|uniref:Uncharacterized protein n=1 Tax=Amphiplicatus metriothermophilus TaxID=1519374 RepID=A0A239PZ90_9PROT|nr:DUF6607 family protein [Amphiplicatus metriothermophilus]MBB5518262.1 hypothetical protein [Amphiplicatus metriothermophilus]SNT75490.1 hypothetical protein SAMN06297382_2766 [Amphiplicatus metriothermophilus]